MDAKYVEVLSEFFDAEDVDPVLLAESLAQPGANTLLEGFAVMRAKAQSGPRPDPEVREAMAARLRQAVHRRRWRGRFARWGVAACLVLAAVGVGFKLASVVERGGATVPAVRQAAPAPAAPGQPLAAVPMPAAPVPPARPAATNPRRPQPPPVPLLRLRLGQWAEPVTDIGGQGQR